MARDVRASTPAEPNDVAARLASLKSDNIRLSHALAEASRERAMLETILASGPVLVLRFVPDTMRITYLSANVERITGYTRDEAMRADSSWLSRLHPDDRDRVAKLVAATLWTRSADLEDECRYRRKDGTYRSFRIRLHVERDATHRPSALVCHALEMEDDSGAPEQVRQAQLEAVRANRAKNEFLSRMSHDLRTPLNAILGFAQILEMEDLTRDQADSVQQILHGGVHLLELINEILDISRIEAGQLSLTPEPVPVAEVVRRVVELARPLGGAQNVALNIAWGDGEPDLYVRADRQRLKQVLMNLVSNGIKYNTPGGDVHVSWERRGQSVRITVTDTGPCIPVEKRPLIFQPFERLGAEQTGIEGTGLGLSVAKGLVEAMAGRIGLDSVPGVGSTFWIELPISAAPPPAAADVPVRALPRARGAGSILYVEDNLSNIRLLERLLSRRPDLHLSTATTGSAALDRAWELQPDLILLDLHLPDMRGEDVLRGLRADVLTAHIPVAVLSADATASQQARLLASGATAYLTKPLKVAELLQLLDERLAERGPDPAA